MKSQIPLVSIILDVVKIILILVVAAVIIMFFIGSSAPPICSFSSFIRHLYHSACIGVAGVELACLPDYVPFEIPLLGCTPPTQRFGEMNAREFSKLIGTEAASCWGKYGSGKLNVLWGESENPAICSVLSARLKDNLNAEILSKTWEDITYGTTYDCTKCDDACEEGYECDLSEKTRCIKYVDRALECEKEGVLPDCSIGRIVSQTFRESDYSPEQYSTIKKKLFGNLSQYVCGEDESYVQEGCCDANNEYYVIGDDGCSVGEKRENICIREENDQYFCGGEPQLPEDMCFVSNVGGENVHCIYCQSDGVGYRPKQCVLTQKVDKEDCLVKISLFNYLEPSMKTFYTLKNSTDSAFILTPYESNFNITGDVDVFIEYIDSFTGVGRSRGIRPLPQECAAAYFVDTCDACEDECLGGMFGLLMLYQGSYATPGTTAVEAGITYIVVPELSAYVFSSATHYAGSIGSKLIQCATCLADKALDADIVACSDKILICMYQKD